MVLAAPVLATRLPRLGSPAGQGIVEGEEIPYLSLGRRRERKKTSEHWIDRDPEIGCFKPGVPRAMYMPHPFQIIQECHQPHDGVRIRQRAALVTIHLAKMDPYPNVAYMGYSVGRWEGDTLVVDVTDFTDATWFDRAGNFHSDALHVVERYTPVGQNVIQYEATMEDPQVFTRPWKISMPLYRRPLEKNAQIMEFRCVEMVEETLYGHLSKRPIGQALGGQHHDH